MLFDIGRSTVAGRAALTVRGELDLATAPQLADAAAALMQSSPEGFVIDLSPTKFLDSSGARTLMVVARNARAAGVPLHVLVPRSNRPVRLPVDLLDLGTAVPLVSAASEIGSSVAHEDAGT